ncbi:MAG TPA: ribonuclease R [Candidatus Paceibacterota bacterium]
MNDTQKPQVLPTIIGKISTIAKGAGFIDDPENDLESIYIEPGFLNCALNGDQVEVKVKWVASTRPGMRGKKEKQGEVIRIVERFKNSYVGTIVPTPTATGISADKVTIFPDDKKAYTLIELIGPEAKTIPVNTKVFVDLLPWTDPTKLPQAKLAKILGPKGINDVEMESIVLDKGFAIGFPEAVEKEAEHAALYEKKISDEELAKRRDIRGTLTFTIDPFDAKDFDDAISFKEVGPDRYEIGVHIADVSHYVRPGTAMDAEAVKRGCSIYLVDRTIPMLPEILSNDICSLNPHEDKCSFSAMFIMDGKANILERWFGRTVMNSDHRFTYETAQSVIDGAPANVVNYSNGIQTPDMVEPGMKYRDVLVKLNDIAKILQAQKFAAGAVEFESEEVKFKLDANGKPIGVYVKERIDTHKLVEEYMLLANREVAKFIFDQIKQKGTKDTGAVYRIHDLPDKEKIKELSIFVKALGFELRSKDGEVTAHDINHLLDQIEGTPQESLVRTATIRSMQKAIYSTKNIGHFGLAFKFYTHFTSPIRRYPDLLVHRILAKHLHNEPFADTDIATFQRISETSTEREIGAAEAERASKKLKQVEYMSERLGKIFKGAISGVSKWGLYVEEEESKSEGMISFQNLGNDYWVFDQKTYSIKGERTGKKYQLGDPITFKVMAADLDKKMLDYAVV